MPYCPSCGTEVRDGVSYCPDCGTSVEPGGGGESSRMSGEAFAVLSTVSSLVAFLLFPPVFGAIGIFTGYQVYKRKSEGMGVALMAFGGVATIAGMVIGAYVLVG